MPKDKEGYVRLRDILTYVKAKLTQYGVDFTHVIDINAHIRRQIYADLVGWLEKTSGSGYNRGHFERKYLYSGLFRLTSAGLKFRGR